MSTTNVWSTQHRLVEKLEELLQRDMSEITDDEIARLVCAAYITLRQHRVNKRGYCRHCYRSGPWWLPRRRKRCTVYEVFGVAMGQPFNILSAWLRDC
ncbi:MAG: hypothetical protein LC808_16260 [Actinobacteria bacterium]|nr:hypothetical protein [Actinomycetota bacterium]